MKISFLLLFLFSLTLGRIYADDVDSYNGSDDKIYNGREVEENHWSTTLAARLVITKADGTYSCSAGVLGPRTLITNAHCLLDATGAIMAAKSITAGFGAHADRVYRTARNWSAWLNNLGSPYDIALIELVEDVPSFVHPAYLGDVTHPLLSGWFVGYGGNSIDVHGNTGVGILRETSLYCDKPTRTNGDRQKSCYSNWDHTPNAVSRGGDSGGVITQYDQYFNRQYLIGLVWGSEGNPEDQFRTAAIDLSKLREPLCSLSKNPIFTQGRLLINNLSCP